MHANPIRSVSRLVGATQKEVVALTADQRADLLAKLEELARKRGVDSVGRSLGPRARIWLDMPDLVRTMLATGVRLGELLALDDAAFDAEARTLAIDWRIIRVPGHGLQRRALRKGNQRGLLLRVPKWSVPMLSRRTDAAMGGSPLFPSASGGWLDPSNVINRIGEAFDECGYNWVTSHVFRKTVATVLDEANLPTGAVADQLGNTRAVAEKHYIARRVANEQAADALENMVTAEPAKSAPFMHPRRRNAVQKDKPQAADLGCCSPGWTRTNNPSVNSRMLCQLSYRGRLAARIAPANG